MFFWPSTLYLTICYLLKVLAKFTGQNCRQRRDISQCSDFSNLNSDFKSCVECHSWSELARSVSRCFGIRIPTHISVGELGSETACVVWKFFFFSIILWTDSCSKGFVTKAGSACKYQSMGAGVQLLRAGAGWLGTTGNLAAEARACCQQHVSPSPVFLSPLSCSQRVRFCALCWAPSGKLQSVVKTADEFGLEQRCQVWSKVAEAWSLLPEPESSVFWRKNPETPRGSCVLCKPNSATEVFEWLWNMDCYWEDHGYSAWDLAARSTSCL